MRAPALPYRQLNSLATWFLATAALAAGAVLLWSTDPPAAELRSLAGEVLITSVGIAVLVNLVNKRRDRQELAEAIGLRHDVEHSGLLAVGADYLDLVDWGHHLSRTRTLDVSGAWSTTWRGAHREELLRLVRRPGAKVRFFLADHTDPACVTELSARFHPVCTEHDVRAKVQEAVADCVRLAAAAPAGAVEVWACPGFRAATIYRMDDALVVTQYHSQPDRQSVPSHAYRPGSPLHSFYERELAAIRDASKQIFP
ncbi:hypothetical protein QIS99_01680 [Streptomyces sp. B-S-A8]|uniref:Uncharacterized protein n=1 Tax=Streptomyces solicavernae TaxID=3043614 RepID=A0ABT6RKI5_9ACTN|nr:hypothetical protein [Streptomyces sp. B-S-A8]MDI3384933.1 hypothetical protein [Streptomyces sp. B-S-A8]